jgi:hypothetical protein
VPRATTTLNLRALVNVAERNPVTPRVHAQQEAI